MHDSTPQPLAYRLPAVAASDAALARLCFDRRFGALLSPRVAGWRVGKPQPPAADAPPSFGLVWSSASARLTVSVPEALDMAATTVVKAVGWSESVRLTCLESILRESIGHIADWAGIMDMRLTAVLNAGVSGAIETSVPVMEWRNGIHSIGVYLRSESLAWTNLAVGAMRSLPPHLGQIANVNVLAALAFGWRRISVAALRTLEVGDVLLASRATSVNSIENAFLVCGRLRQQAVGRACQVEQTTITVLGEHWMNEQAMTEAALAQPGASNPLTKMEVDLHLELQVVSIPMGELANMRPGYVLELPIAAADAAVDLVVGGQVFGRAELICIGDRLGARIIELNHDAG